MQFDLSKIPFTRYGSYLAVSLMKKGQFKRFSQPDGLYIRSLHTYSRASTLFRMDLLYQERIEDFRYMMTAEELELITENGHVGICFPDEHSMRFRGEGVILRLTAIESDVIDHLHTLDDGSIEFNSYLNGLKVRFSILEGGIASSCRWDGWFCEDNGIVIGTGGPQVFDVVMTEYDSTAEAVVPGRTYTQSVLTSRKSFSEYMSPWSDYASMDSAGQAIYKAGYINWSSVVAPNAHMTRYGMLMSKNWMNKIWAWDHCFNAMALAGQNNSAAADQFLILFDHQHKDGSLPDLISDGFVSRTYYKLPIHGWVLGKLLSCRGFKADLNELYGKLKNWTDWWLGHRQDKRTGLCRYNHNNESGWDNGSVFVSGEKIITPELNAFLVLQMECLAGLAEQLARPADVRFWKEKSESLLKNMLEYMVFDNELLPVRQESLEPVHSKSLMPLEAVVLGKRIPPHILRNLITKINGHICEFGLVTELRDSEYFEDHYWRGPIWAPSAYIVADGLVQAGEHETAYEIVRSYVRNCIGNGFSENFSALTGRGLCDGAYTWSSSVFLLFLREWKQQLTADGLI